MKLHAPAQSLHAPIFFALTILFTCRLSARGEG